MKTKCYFLNGALINIGEWDEQREPAHTIPAVTETIPAVRRLVPSSYHPVTKEVVKPAHYIEEEPATVKIIHHKRHVPERIGNPIPAGVVIEEREVIETAHGRFLATDHQQLRAPEYPPITDQLDALWKGGPEADAMRAKIEAVKSKYPKA